MAAGGFQDSLKAVVDKVRADTQTAPTPQPPRQAAPASGSWQTAPADRLTLGHGRELDRGEHIAGLAMPQGGHRLYHGRTVAGRNEVILRDLDSGAVLSSFVVPDRVEALALSPEGDRLLVCLGFGGKAVLVRDLVAQRSIPLPISLGGCGSSDRPLTWIDAKTVIFDQEVLDLDTLQRRPHGRELRYPVTVGEESGTHPNAYFETVDHTGLAICDRHSEYCLQQFPYMETWRSTADMLHVVMIDFCNNCDPDYRLTSWQLTTRAPPVRELSLALAPSPSGRDYQESDPESFATCVARSVAFFGRVNGPKINPLTGKAIGGDGTDRGTVKLVAVPGSQRWRAIVVLERLPIRPGDVVDSVWSASDCQGDRGYRGDGLALVLGGPVPVP